MKQYDKALVDANRAIELKPDFERAYYIRAVVYLFMGNNSNAIEDFNKALELNENPATPLFSPAIVLYRYGLTYNQLKEYNGAIRDFSKVIEYEKNNAAAYYNRAHSNKQIGKNDEALSDLKKAAQLGDVRAQKAINK